MPIQIIPYIAKPMLSRVHTYAPITNMSIYLIL